MADYIAYILLGFVLWIFMRIGLKSSKSSNDSETGSGKSDNLDRKKILVEAQKVASGVKSLKQCLELEDTLKIAQTRLSEARSEKAVAKAKIDIDVLSNAVALAKKKTLAMLFAPDFDLDTPLKHLQVAYKLFPLSEYGKARVDIGGNDSNWLPMDYRNLTNTLKHGIEYDPELKSLLKFRDVVESALPEGEKIKQINILVSNDEILAKHFLEDEEFTAGLQWFAKKLKDDGLPMAKYLYWEGYTTPESCLEINLETFSKRKGVGEKTVEELRAYQDKVRKRMNKQS